MHSSASSFFSTSDDILSWQESFDLEFKLAWWKRYGVDTKRYGAPDETYGAPDETYGAPDETYGAPDETYGPWFFSLRTKIPRK